MNWHTNETIDIIDNDEHMLSIARRRRHDAVSFAKSMRLAIEGWYESANIPVETRVDFNEVDWDEVCNHFNEE